MRRALDFFVVQGINRSMKVFMPIQTVSLCLLTQEFAMTSDYRTGRAPWRRGEKTCAAV